MKELLRKNIGSFIIMITWNVYKYYRIWNDNQPQFLVTAAVPSCSCVYRNDSDETGAVKKTQNDALIFNKHCENKYDAKKGERLQ